MLFLYKALDQNNAEVSGSIDALNQEVAVASLQRRSLVITSLTPADKGSFLNFNFYIFNPVSHKDIVVLSRQVATLFQAQVSALRIFQMLSAETPNKVLGTHLSEITNDIQGGSAISKALEKHPQVFSPFYVNMVRAGEESGKLDETFLYLADYLDRSYAITSKAKNALIYPAFVVLTFVVVMVLMLTFVIPKISTILVESGQDIPLYTKIVIGMSTLLTDYGIFVLIAFILGGFGLFRYTKTERGALYLSQLKLNVPYVGDLYRKLYLSRIADNLSTMIQSGIPIVRAIEITSAVVDNAVYRGIMTTAAEKVKGGSPLSESLSGYPEIPSILTQMTRVGEESGEMAAILKTLANFYNREVTGAVDTLVDLIEPVMIVLLATGVGFLLASVLIPIYNISQAY